MDLESARLWTDIGQWVFNGLVAVYLWITRRHKATIGQIEAACDKLEAQEREIIRLKASLPSQNQFDRLSKQIEHLSTEMSEMKGRLGGINRAVDLMNEFLINRERN